MPPSSVREGRAQTEPLAALAAVAVVAVALALYAGAFEAALPESADRSLASDAADRVERALTAGGVVRPVRFPGPRDPLSQGPVRTTSPRLNTTSVGPDGYHVNATLAAGGRSWSAGPAAPDAADVARRRVSVRLGPGRVRPGSLEVRVWE